MDAISDAELVLFHYRDGLAAPRLAAIEAALRSDTDLARRYALLQATLAASTLEQPPEPSAAFVARLQARIEVLTATATPPARSAARAPAGFSRRRWRQRLGFAAAAGLLLAIGFEAGQRRLPAPLVPAANTQAAAPRLDRARIYRARLARHLDGTRQALLTAVNAEGRPFTQGNAALAQALLDNNRLYLAAAEAAGDRRLADLLRTLEPVLIELANPAQAADIPLRKGVSDYVERSDLLFQVRAAEAGLQARPPIET